MRSYPLLLILCIVSLPAQADLVIVANVGQVEVTASQRIAALELITQEEGGEIFLVDDDRVLLRIDERSYSLIERLTGSEPFLYHACIGWSLPCADEPFPVVVHVEPSGRNDYVAAVEQTGATIAQETPASDGTIRLLFGAPFTAIADLAARAEVVRFSLASFGDPLGGQDELLLGEGFRFIAEATWYTASDTGQAGPIQWTTDTGAFYFFRPDNVELTLKLLDGCAITGHYWVFVAGMTNVGVELTVRSSTASKSYSNLLGNTFETITDTTALPCD